MEKWSRIKLLIMALLMVNNVSAGNVFRYRVYLSDKSISKYSLSSPEDFLSASAIVRREKQNLKIDSTDIPVCQAYIKALEKEGIRCVLTSRWNNTVLVEMKSEKVVEQIRNLPFVSSVMKVGVSSVYEKRKKGDRKNHLVNVYEKNGTYYGRAHNQILLHKGDSLHAMGFRGEGINIAVIDAGFYNVDVIDAFKNINLLGVHDFVNIQSDIYQEHNHGLKVLSCLAADMPNVMVGTAPKANYLLLRTEEIETEQPAEEDMWAAAVEYADSTGVDIVNTSLGYFQFDAPFGGYRYEELDGRTSLMSKTAAMMAQKGMLLVCSAGNTGDGSWKKITTPGDADNVLTVGAIRKDSVNADFSAVGNTADGRIKPDVMALGYEAAVIDDDGSVMTANGTSFSTPIFCGLAACLWQACPWLSVYELIDVIRKSGNIYDSPNNILGYGIVDIMKAYRMGLDLRH